MINRIIDFSADNKFIVFALVAVGCVAGWWSMQHMTLDAIPDLSDTQVIIFSRWDRSPDMIEDQVTYPIVTTMVGAPKVKAVRGFSDFGYSYVYVIFEEGTDIYWARSRTQEYLSAVLPRLPAGARTEIGPDATPLGWIFQYALVDTSGTHSLDEMRSYQDFYLKYYLRSVPGVAEVAPVGGFSKQYQVNVDPNRLQGYGLSINQVVAAVRDGNYESAGRLMEFGGTEYNVRGRGYITSVEDLKEIAVSASDTGTPITLKDIGEVVVGPDLRRGLADLDGTRRCGLRHRHHAPGPECPGGDRAGQGQIEGDRAGAAGRGEGRARLRPVGADPAFHRQPEVDGHRGAHHRGPGGFSLPAAYPQRPHSDDHPAGGDPYFLHPF